MLANTFTNVKIANRFLNPNKVIVVCIAVMEVSLVRQFNKIKNVVKELVEI
jgi:hypothetical protein